MKALKVGLKILAGLIALLLALAWLEGAGDLMRAGAVAAAAALYGFFTLTKMIEQGQNRTAAALERIEAELHAQREGGLTPYQQNGLDALIADLRRREDAES